MAKKKAKKATAKKATKPAAKKAKKPAAKKATAKKASKPAAKKAKKAAPKKAVKKAAPKKVAKPAAAKKVTAKPKVPSLEDIAGGKSKKAPVAGNPFAADDLRDVGSGLGADAMDHIEDEAEDAYGIATKEADLDETEDDAFDDLEDEEDDEEGLF